MDSLLNYSTLENCLNRIDKLEKNQKKLWGKMSCDQMLNHCKKPLDLAMGNLDVPSVSWPIKILAQLFIKRKLYNNSPWVKNTRTIDVFLVKDHYSFENEKEQLKKSLMAFYKAMKNNLLKPHPYFGYFTQDQWGKVQFKHLDHHLRQFGV